ncbi:MAG: hypothetical protein CFH18_00486 [Alphaproteobacteria bacterium MarineAlpha5_Bin8]|nr:MAG: hypothetical protein CFH17_00133 [Alphaproteobacteria bacterium MarineAlpha5_Bin7]PPR46989.1 MAG: hypothetical protein CFH18_00486 [Alphaproteobacteria bacterium MarineAlpha5_Bin8]PPR54925.1 MAG: hypothetical protein CFH16_00102 [Alphaproteobacteria bacterium MarineAlpha5_Bin6]|tara:strand:+ start:5775 stop:6638 length:864 start_codon:yes stop_codon:yes gene_type:complete
MRNDNILSKIDILRDKKILDRNILSQSFSMICEKILFEDNNTYIFKYYSKKNSNYNAIISEGKSLKYLYLKFPNFFPKVIFLNNEVLVMSFIKHNNIKGDNYEKKLADILVQIHSIKNSNFGFDFDTPIGGLKQPSKYLDNWTKFYAENRLNMIYELINKNESMPGDINRGIENIIKNIQNLIPKNPEPSLIHGDLWEGNILFNDGKLKGLIDPGIHFAHNEMELAYLTWFKYVSDDFLNYYSEKIKIDKQYKEYEEIYQLYYCLLNVFLWSREYIKNTRDLVLKFI